MSVKRALGLVSNKMLGGVGLELRRKSASAASPHKAIDRASLRGVLEHAKSLGWTPQTLIDVGVADGTPDLYEAFPTAHMVLVEPLVEYVDCLEQIKSRYRSVEYVVAAATQESGQIVINVHPDLFGSSIYRERENSDVNGVPRSVQAVTIDSIAQERELKGPFLIKADVQGAELDVLRGASKVLQQTDMVVLEVVLFDYFEGGNRFSDVINFMSERGFAVYDVFGLHYRLLDGALSQVDVCFVADNSIFRKHHVYASTAQRANHNESARRRAQSAITVSDQSATQS